MDKPMFVNPKGNNFIDDFLNAIGPSVGQDNAIRLKNEALILNLRNILITKGIVSEAEHDALLKEQLKEIKEMLENAPRPSPFQPGS